MHWCEQKADLPGVSEKFLNWAYCSGLLEHLGSNRVGAIP